MSNTVEAPPNESNEPNEPKEEITQDPGGVASDKKDDGDSSAVGGDSSAVCSGKKTTRESHDEAFWFTICQQYEQFQRNNPGKNCSQRAFLKSKEALQVTGAPRECRSFSRYWKRYEQGELNPSSNRRRRRAVGYVEIEERLATYLRLRADIFVRGDTNGATWAKLKQKCVKWGAKELKELQTKEEKGQGGVDGDNTSTGDASTLGEKGGKDDKDTSEDKTEQKYTDFRASPGWLHKVLKRNNIESKYLQSEMDAKEEQVAMEEWIPTFHQAMVDLNIGGSCLYNAASSCLFYRQLPSTKQQRKNRKQHVPTTDRIAIMVCSAADGTKVPLAAVGKQRSPFPDEEYDDDDDDDEKNGDKKPSATESPKDKKKQREPPIQYASQENAWFDQNATLWWIHNVFWPFHTQQHGDVPCVLLMDYCPANVELDKAYYEKPLPKSLKIIHFPVNMSRRRHPSESGIIGSIKLGYKLKMALSISSLFDLFGGFQGAQDRYYSAKGDEDKERGSGGLACGDPATLHDALQILKQVWSTSNKFATTTLILEGWKKAKILPSWWEEEIDAWIRNGAAPRNRRKEGWSDQDCIQLCHVLQALFTKVEEAGLERAQLETSGLRDSYVLMQREGDTFRAERDEDVWAMASAWIEIEDDPIVREHILEYECDQVLATKKHSLQLEMQIQLEEEQKEENQVATRFERVQQGLDEAKDYAKFLGMDEKIVGLLDRFENKLSQMVKKLQKVKATDGRKKRVRLNPEPEEEPQDMEGADKTTFI